MKNSLRLLYIRCFSQGRLGNVLFGKLGKTIFIAVLCAFPMGLFAQLSPGDLTTAHEHLEGLSNCTQCHVIGEKVTSEKCLACHKEIKNLIDKKQGFHASEEATAKDCFKCHSEHHGKKFEIVRFDQEKFDHKLTGYALEGKHGQTKCEECHKTEFIHQKISQKKKGKTFLGLQTNCLSCHDDYHQQTMSKDCASCHGFDSFKPAVKFDHAKTDFPLRGQHKNVTCAKCHKEEEQGGKKFQHFANVPFKNCTSCHKDVHENKFGQNCKQCHNENSFHQVAGISDFNHDKTAFPLQGKHRQVDCKTCHKQSFTTPIAHAKCADCHADYHKGQFAQKSIKSDCAECHTVNGFTPSLFTIEKHNQGDFKLAGGHMATPCFACHQKNDRWEFRNIGVKCVDCHDDFHKGAISEKFMPEKKCESCHTTETWNKVNFNHQKTDFELTGKHAEVSCRKCHFQGDEIKNATQRFANLTSQCENCHQDAHHQQFQANGKTQCERCHGFENWKAERFDHNQSRFKLEGAHSKVDCLKCHPVQSDPAGEYRKYKFNTEMKCANCHS